MLVRDLEESEYFIAKLKEIRRDQSVVDTLQVLIQQKMEVDKAPGAEVLQYEQIMEPQRENVSFEESEEALNRNSQ